MTTKTVFIEDVELEVEFTFYPCEPAVLCGLPEHWRPVTGDEIEIESIIHEGFEVYDLLKESVIKEIEDKLT